MKTPNITDLALTRLNALKSTNISDPKSNNANSADYLRAIEDSKMMLVDLFKNLNIPFNPQYA